MGEKKKKSEGKSNTFSYKKELKSLVEKNVLPKKIADKLIEKLDEKNVSITEKQLNKLVEKINNVLQKYASNGTYLDSNKKPSVHKNTDLKNIVESIEKLEKRLGNLETELLGEEEAVSSNKIVTTDDIEIPDKKYKYTRLINVDPLIDVPSDPESVIVLMKWLQFLIDRCGRSHLPEILEYYVDIGWISDEAKIRLIDYSNGITEENKEGVSNKKISNLPSKDHIQSLIFIQKLKGRDFDKHFIDRIENEISRTIKKIDNHNIK